MSISVPERGSRQVSADQLKNLQASPEFWALIESGVISVTLRPAGDAQLNAGPYVGRAVCGREVLEIQEKIPGALGSLLSYASGSALMLESITGTRTEIGPLIEVLISVFLNETRRYLTNGKEFRYARTRHRGSMVAGAIKIPPTAQLWARGSRHQIVFDRNTITHETDKNIVINSALREIEYIAPTLELESNIIPDVRTLRMYFEDYPSSMTRGRTELAHTAEGLASSTQPESALLSLAALLLRHESFDNVDWLGGTTPRTWFVNLETLFEDALRKQINQDPLTNLIAQKGSSFSRSIYRPPEEAKAEPDIVLIQDGEFVGIGDAKYKAWSGSPRRADLYQLLVHCAAFNSPMCFLAFASNEYQSVFLGHSVTGAAVRAYALDVTEFDESVSALLSDVMSCDGSHIGVG